MSKPNPTIANTDQQRVWSDEVGAKWADHSATMDALLAGTTDVLIDHASPALGEAVLDIGCGQGVSSFAAATRVGPTGRVHGLDISRPFVADAQALAAQQGHGNVSFEFGDAQVASFQPDYDLMISRFGSMFFENPGAALANMRDALKPGGRLCLLCWGEPRLNEWFGLTRLIATRQLGPAERPHPHAPGPVAFRDTDRVTGLLDAAGYGAITVDTIDQPLIFPGTPQQLAATALHISGASPVIAQHEATEDQRTAIYHDLCTAFAERAQPDGVHIAAQLLVYRAMNGGV